MVGTSNFENFDKSPLKLLLFGNFSKIILKKLKNERSAVIIGGDFNINLLRLNEREKFQEFYDMFVTDNLYPEITLPTRFSKNNATLIDQIF